MSYTGTERRKPGRPAKSDSDRAQRVVVHISMDVPDYDAACRVALRQGVPVAKVVRWWIRRGMSAPDAVSA
jgi:hypothetical protein